MVQVLIYEYIDIYNVPAFSGTLFFGSDINQYTNIAAAILKAREAILSLSGSRRAAAAPDIQHTAEINAGRRIKSVMSNFVPVVRHTVTILATLLIQLLA